MTGAQFVTHRLVLVPLTPVHIGGGEEAQLLPQDYRLAGDHVERIDLRRVLGRMPPAERGKWIRDMEQARDDAITQTLRQLHGKARAEEVIERIPISPESAREMDLAGAGQGRRNQIDAFFRAGGRPVLPGSSLKGALRTAWAAALARQMRPRPQAWQAVEAELFGIAKGKRAQDTDPFRDVAVADTPLPEGATRIDPVRPWKKQPVRDGAAAYGFGSVGQMHRERLRSVADGGTPPVVEVALGLRATDMARAADARDAEKRPEPTRVPGSLAALLAALEAHHAPLWQREVEEKFFKGPSGDRLRQALGLFAGFRRGGEDPEAALIRLGWASHAEAKSLAGLRRIERPQVKGEDRIAEEGSTRHVVNLAGHPLPFGWALLVRKDAWERKIPARWLGAPAQRAAPGSGGGTAAPADRRSQTALGQQIRYAKGQRVRVAGEVAELLEAVTEAMRPDERVQVSFDGDIETVKVGEIEGPA